MNQNPAALRHQSRGSEPQSVRLPSFRKALLVVNYKLPRRELHHFTPSNTRASSTVCQEGIATPD